MKIAVSSSGSSMDAQVDPRFGRCQFFIIVDSESGEFKALPNEFQGASGGAGTQAGQLMVSNEVGAVLTGNCGPNAFAVLQGAGVQVVTGVSGTVRQAVDRFQQGTLPGSAAPNVESHAGMAVSGGPVVGPGPGGGRGRGCGGGRGGGMGRGGRN
ncbi:MAG: NifB/NifX family molybdenum-iron cluster-binding protein [Deltaproteobacteria bacterium]|nr:NifB/NifX family molybdenum-iron cluster-binding protein [Candidatus Anaeroferrophillus wilburensis]MBN2889135.1 NifB/NifX family molybdenum-iron cluster-binding protein [Deltaproteobacteria bacterium]